MSFDVPGDPLPPNILVCVCVRAHVCFIIIINIIILLF